MDHDAFHVAKHQPSLDAHVHLKDNGHLSPLVPDLTLLTFLVVQPPRSSKSLQVTRVWRTSCTRAQIKFVPFSLCAGFRATGGPWNGPSTTWSTRTCSSG